MLFLILLLCLYCFAQDQDIRDGDAAFIKLKYDDAIKFYTKAINVDPGNVRALYKRATVYQQRHAFRDALSDLNEVIQLDPDYQLALIARGKLNKDAGKFAQAKQDLEKVANSKKESTSKSKAQKELKDIIDAEEFLRLGNERYQANQLEAAKQAYTESISKAPQWTAPRLARTKVSLATKQYNEVIEDTLKILKAKNNDLEAMQVRAQAFRYLGELDSAEKLYESCLVWDKSNTECSSSLAGLKNWRLMYQTAEKRVDNNYPKLALQDIQQCLEYDPQWDFFNLKLKILKAKALNKLGSHDEALLLCEEILSQEPENTAVFIIKGDIYLAKENYDEAVRQYERAANKGDNNAQEKLRNAQKQQKMAARKDYYKILGIAKTASASEIKKSYRKLAMQYHPDKLKDLPEEQRGDSDTRMKEIGEAYAILSDQEKKATYDRGDEFDQQQGNPFYGFQGFQGFGGGGFNFKFNQ